MKIDLRDVHSSSVVIASACRRLSLHDVLRLLWKVYQVRGGTYYKLSMQTSLSKGEIKRMIAGKHGVSLCLPSRLLDEIFPSHHDRIRYFSLIDQIFQKFRASSDRWEGFLDASA